MGFDINYGSPGILGIGIIMILAFSGLILLSFVLRSAKIAHDDVIHDIEEEGGDLKG